MTLPTHIQLTEDLKYGSQTAEAGTILEVKGERYNAQCWDAAWNGKAVIVPKAKAQPVEQDAE